MTARILAVAAVIMVSSPGAAVEPTDGSGSAVVWFNSVQGTHIDVPVDTRGTWKVIYTVGPGGMRPGGGLLLRRYGWWDFRFGTCKQTSDPTAEDYVTARTSREGASVEIAELADYYKIRDLIRVVLKGEALLPGDTITLTFGDTSGGGPGTVVPPQAYPNREIRVLSDCDGDGVFALCEPILTVTRTARAASRLVVVARTSAHPGEGFWYQVRAEDPNGNVDTSFTGTVELCSEPRGVSQRIEFRPEDEGCVFREASLPREGVYFLLARTPDGRLTGRSNPVEVVPEGVEPIWWGDIHVHTYESDGTDWLPENYRFARETAALDFVGMTDHLCPAEGGGLVFDGAYSWYFDKVGLPRRTVEEWWRHQLDVGAAFNEPGRFVTFVGYEWSGSSGIGGDHNLLFAFDAPLVNENDLNEVYERLAEMDDGANLLINGHVGGRIANWDWHDPRVEPLAEVCSVHGHFEWFYQEGLSRGYKVGAIGAGDNHHGRPGYSVWHRFGRMGLAKRSYGVPGGLAAVRSPELTRRGIMRALRTRNCYATSGPRIILEFDVAGTPMGGACTVEGPPRVTVRAVGCRPIDRIEVVRNEVVARTFIGGGYEERFSFVDENCPRGESYYYVRVSQEDEELAWSSPVWVTRTDGPERDASLILLKRELRSERGVENRVGLRPLDIGEGTWRLEVSARGSGSLTLGEALYRIGDLPSSGGWQPLGLGVNPSLVRGATALSVRSDADASLAVRNVRLVRLCGPGERLWNDDAWLEAYYLERYGRGEDFSRELEEVLARRAPGRFEGLRQVRVVDSDRGRYALFFGYDREAEVPVRISYFPDFTEERLHIYPGLGNYGPMRR